MEPVCYKHSDRTGKYYCAKYQRYLCEDCLACQDPTIYCKYRNMCFIWEVVKHGTPDMQDALLAAKTDTKEGKQKKVYDKGSAVVTFLPSNKTIEVEKGSTRSRSCPQRRYIHKRALRRQGSCAEAVKSGLKPEKL